MLRSTDGTNWVSAGFDLPLVDYGSYYVSYYAVYAYRDYGCFTTVCPFRGTFLVGGLDGVLMQSASTWSVPALDTLLVSSGGFTFSFNQQIDVPYHIQGSTDLVHWENLAAGVGSGQPIQFTDPDFRTFPQKILQDCSAVEASPKKLAPMVECRLAGSPRWRCRDDSLGDPR